MPSATIGLALPTQARWELKPRRPWVARIDGLDLRYDLSRNFLDGKTDYRDADKKGRGAVKYYVLSPGLYEVYEPRKKGERRYFLRANEDGTTEELPPSVVKEALRLVFEPLCPATVFRVFEVRAGLEGVSLLPPAQGVTYRGLYGGREIIAFWGVKQVRRTLLRLVSTYVMPDCRRQGAGTACIRDAMEQAQLAACQIECYTRGPQVYLDHGWRQSGAAKGEKVRVVFP